MQTEKLLKSDLMETLAEAQELLGEARSRERGVAGEARYGASEGPDDVRSTRRHHCGQSSLEDHPP